MITIPGFLLWIFFWLSSFARISLGIQLILIAILVILNIHLNSHIHINSTYLLGKINNYITIT